MQIIGDALAYVDARGGHGMVPDDRVVYLDFLEGQLGAPFGLGKPRVVFRLCSDRGLQAATAKQAKSIASPTSAAVSG